MLAPKLLKVVKVPARQLRQPGIDADGGGVLELTLPKKPNFVTMSIYSSAPLSRVNTRTSSKLANAWNRVVFGGDFRGLKILT